MKERGLAEWTNYLFFIVGIVAIIILPYTVSTYLSYAEEGYGVKVEMGNVTAGFFNFVGIAVIFENPGQFDIQVINASLTFTTVDGGSYNFQFTVDETLKQKESTAIDLKFPNMNQNVYDSIKNHTWKIDMEFSLYISERDANVPLHFSYSEGVSPGV